VAIARRVLAFGAALLAAVALACLAADALARATAPAPPRGATCAVLVPGYPTRDDGAPSAIQRARVASAVEVLRAHGCARLVLSGAGVANRFVEAEAMARIAAELGVPAERIAVEPSATNTWQNVAASLPLVAGYEAVLVVSESFHARRAVRYLCKQSAARCAHAFPIASRVPWRLAWLRVASPLYELRARLRDAARSEPATLRAGEAQEAS
jgi:uncharacterized SAM-binding protein YcdF (DUF218 family)